MRYLIKIVMLLITGFFPLIIHAQIEVKESPKFFSEKSRNIPVYTLPEIDRNVLLKKDIQSKNQNTKIFKYAKIIDTNIDLLKDGLCQTLPNGDKIWYMQIKGQDAYSLGVYFSLFRIPKNARLFVYSTDKKDVRGAFTYRNNKPNKILAIAPVMGDDITIEYFEPNDVNFNGELYISSVAYDYKNIFSFLDKKSKGFGDAGDCNVNINCEEGAGWQDVKHSVCRVIYSGSVCSGALINNTNQDGYPYFLTANHCIDNSFEASTAIFYFNYESPFCTDLEPTETQTISGSNLVATAPGNSLDFSLLELSVKPPPHYNPYYAGWNRDIVDPDTVTSIHHPKGDIKKISVAYEGATTSDYEYGYDDFSHWWINTWDVGTTEDGSSGSPLFNKEMQIIGDLSGGDANCNYNFNDYYSQFHRGWDEYSEINQQLKHWLDPKNSNVLSLNGYKPFDTIPSNLRIALKDTVARLYWNDISDTSNLEQYIIYRNSEKLDSSQISSFVDTLYNDSLYYYEISARLKSPLNVETNKTEKKYVRPMLSLSIPFMENFESQNYIPDLWYEEKSNGTVNWKFVSGRSDGILDTAYEGSNNALFKNLESEFSTLVLPKFNLSAYSHVILSFYIHNEKQDENLNRLDIIYKQKDSLDWEVIRSFNKEYDQWTKINIPLPNLTEEYHIAFKGIGYEGLGICIDSVSITEDTSYISPDILVDKNSICLNDTVEYSTSMSDTNLLEWYFGKDAIPQTGNGAGPLKVTYANPGIKSISLIVNDTYAKNNNDIVFVYDNPVPTFTQNINTLTSTLPFGNQWYLNNVKIPDATDQTYVIEEDGDYSLEVINSSGCVGISENKYLVVNNIKSLDENRAIQIYPNPNNGSFTIKVNQQLLNTKIEYRIFDITGRNFQNGFIHNQEQEIILSNVKDGIYLIKILDGNDFYVSKIIIKK